MEKKKIIRFVESLVILPLATMSMPIGTLPSSIDIMQVPQPQSVLIQKENIETPGIMAYNQAMDSKELTNQTRAYAIDSYFESLPLEGQGAAMVKVAEEYDLDWRLIPAIAFRETTAGKFACPETYKRTGDIRYTYNVFGWGSCKIKFDSYQDAFDTLAWNLSGNNPKTAQHYAGKNIKDILLAYNPAQIAPKYVPQVIKIMNEIGSEDLGEPSEFLAKS